MNSEAQCSPQHSYARCIDASKRVNWTIDDDVIKGRQLDYSKKFLPDGLSQVSQINWLNDEEKRLLTQVQGRTYSYIFGLAERFINAKVIELSRSHALGDQVILESLSRFSQEELKHQELFRRLDDMMAEEMPPGYVKTADPSAVAAVVLSKSNWAVLAFTCHIELFTLVHYRESMEPDREMSEVFKDVFRYHWLEESQHAILDELEWRRENARLSDEERDAGVDDLIALVAAFDDILVAQSREDARYFAKANSRELSPNELEELDERLLKSYRWQYIVSGLQVRRFQEILGSMISDTQRAKIERSLSRLLYPK